MATETTSDGPFEVIPRDPADKERAELLTDFLNWEWNGSIGWVFQVLSTHMRGAIWQPKR